MSEYFIYAELYIQFIFSGSHHFCATMKCSAKDLVYGIMYKDNEGGITITDEVSENQLAYAAGCPVTIDLTGDGLKIEGNILLSEQSPSDHTKFLYTALIPWRDFKLGMRWGLMENASNIEKSRLI